MKHLFLLATAIALLGLSAFVQAGPRRGGGGVGNGVQGTVSTIGSKGFAMFTKDGKTVNVACDNNTKFTSGKDAAKSTDLHEGVDVSVQGGRNGDQILAASVNIILKHKKE